MISAQVRGQSKVWSGDFIGLRVDGIGLLSTPFFNGEPIPENHEKVSHIRISRGKKFSTADYRRCIFRIENEIGLKTDIVYGAVIHLSHHPTEMLLSAADCEEDTEYEEPLILRGVQLVTPDEVNPDDMAHKWIISPRYHLRDESDPVNRNDYITIRNAKYKNLHLTSFVNPNKNPIQNSDFEDFVGLGPPLYTQYKPGLQILLFRKCPLLQWTDGGDDGGSKAKKKGGKGAKKGKKKKKKQHRQKSEEEEEQEKLERSTVFSGDYVRILHRELNGHIICRVDDEEALLSVVTPLGSLTRKRNMLNRHNTHGVFVRSQTAQQPIEQHDFPCAMSSLGIWQIIASEVQTPTENAAMHGMVKYAGSSIRLRHAATGLFLCIRPQQEEDTTVLKTNSSFAVAKIMAIHKEQAMQALQKANSRDNQNLVVETTTTSPRTKLRSATAANMVAKEYEHAISTQMASTSADSATSLLPEAIDNPRIISMSDSYDATGDILSKNLKGDEKGRKVKSVQINTAGNTQQSKIGLARADSIEDDGTHITGISHRSSVGSSVASALQAMPSSLSMEEKMDLFIESVEVSGMKNVDWAGKHFSGIQLRFGDKNFHHNGDWEFRTRISDHAGNSASWQFMKADRSVHFHMKPTDINDKALEVKVNRMSNYSGELPIGRGFLEFAPTLWDMPDGESISFTVAVKDYKTSMDAGIIELRIVKNAVISEFDEVEFRNMQDEIADLNAENAELDFGEEESDAEEKEREKNLREINWVVGTSMYPDRYTKFSVVELDASDDDNAVVNYNERLILVHEYTKRHLSLNNLLDNNDSHKVCIGDINSGKHQHRNHTRNRWWQYTSDVALTPSAVEEESIVDSEVCQFDRVDLMEVKDLFYCSRFLSVAQACASALQLTPAVSHLYYPMYRHFAAALNTLSLWTVGAVDTEARLCPWQDHPGLLYGSSSHDVVVSCDFSEDEIRSCSSSQDSHESKLVDEDNEYCRDSNIGNKHSIVRHQLANEDYSSSDGERSQRAIPVTSRSSRIIRYMTSNSLLDDPRVWQSKEPKGHNTVEGGDSRKLREIDDIAEKEEKQMRLTSSSIAPFIGRSLLAGTAFWPEANEKQCSALNNFVAETLSDMFEKDQQVNQLIVRRQSILAESGFLESCLYFLDISFMLERTIQISRGDSCTELAGTELPSFVLNCCNDIHTFLRSLIYKNEKIALGVLAIHGSFLSMISQKIIGWDPPMELILKLTCRDEDQSHTKKTGAGSYSSSGEHERKQLLTSAMNGALSAASSSSASQTHRSSSHGDISEGSKVTERSLSIERILADSVSASDILQIVQQMHGLHQQDDPTALKILKLLTMLCRSGRARRHFQNLLARAVIRNDTNEYHLWGEKTIQPRDSSFQSNCILFHTRFDRNQWEVKFRFPFVFPPQEIKNQEALQKRLRREAHCLKNIFYQYNDDDQADDNILDLSESFRLLEDLGLGGPFLYNEMRNVEGSSIAGFLDWYAYHFAFLYPTSANSYCQLSPYEAMKQMHLKSLSQSIAIEMERNPLNPRDIADSVDYLEVLNSRFSAFYLRFEDDEQIFSTAAEQMRKPEVFTGNKQTASSPKSVGGMTTAATIRKRLSLKRFTFEKQQSSKRKRFPNMKDTRARSKSNGRWFEFSQALEEDFEDSSWFHHSLILLAELCKLGNSYCQQLITVVLPAECIVLSLQESRLKYEDRAILLQLLCHVYIHHDLVYPTRCLPLFLNFGYCGHNEEIFNPAVAVGQVFNSLSRAIFRGDGAEEGAHLRRLLFNFLIQSLSSLKLFSNSRAEARFKEELLSTFIMLFSRGFFQDPEFRFFESADAEINTVVRMEDGRTPLDYLKGIIGLPTEKDEAERPRVVTVINEAEGANGVQSAFTIDWLQQLLVRKVNDLILVHQCTKDFSVMYIPEAEINGIEEGVVAQFGLNHPPARSSNKKNKSRRTSRWQKPLRKNITLDRAKLRARRRRNFDKVRNSFYYFDSHFSDLRNSAILHKVINILSAIHDAKQLLRVQKTWNFVNNAVEAVCERAYSKNVEDLEKYLPRLHFDQFIESAFQVRRHHEAAPGYTQALFYCSIFQNFSLRQSCFNLMNRQLCLVRDAYRIYSSLTLTSDAHSAFLHRLISVYSQHLLKNMRIVLERPFPINGFYLEQINFAVENIRALFLSSFLDRLDHSNKRTRQSASVPLKGGVISHRRKAPRVGTFSGYSPTPILYKPEQDIFNYLMQPIPCPAGPDDFFELDIDELVNNSRKLTDLCSYYDLTVQEVGELAVELPILQCDETFAALTLNLLEHLLRHLKAPYFLAWTSLYASEKYAIEQILELLSSVGVSDSSLCCRWYHVLSNALLHYFPESTAAGSMIILLLCNCEEVVSGGENSFAVKILQIVEENGLLQTLFYPKVISALLKNSTREAVELGSFHLLNRIQQYAEHFDFRLPPEKVCGCPILRERLYYLLRPINLILGQKIKIDLSPEIISAIRVVFSSAFCSNYLKSEVVPLALKSSLVNLSSLLYSGVFPIEEIVLEDLRNMRCVFRLDVELDFEGCSQYCINFLCQGVVALIRQKILRSTVLSTAQVNGHVYLAIASAVWTSGIPNRAVAHYEAEKLRQTFAAVYPADLMDSNVNRISEGLTVKTERNEVGTLAYSIFQAMLLVINLLRERDGFLMSKLNDVQRFDVLWDVAAVLMLMERYTDRICNPKGGVGVQQSFFRGVRERLDDVFHGIIAEMLALRTEAHIKQFYATSVVEIAHTQFNEVSAGAPRKASATLLNRASSGNSTAQLERSQFVGSMSIAVDYPIEYLMASPPARFLIDKLQDGAEFLDKNGALLFGDFRSPVIKSGAFVRKFSALTDFDLWMKGSGRYLQSVMRYLGKVANPEAAEYNLLHMLTGLLQHSIEDIRDSKLLSLNLRIALLDRETMRLRRLQLAMKEFGALDLITKLIGKCNQYASDDFVWNYAPLTLSLANSIISWQNMECQELIMEAIETGISMQKPPEMNCLVGLQYMIRKCCLALSYADADEDSADASDEKDNVVVDSSNIAWGTFPQGEQTRILKSVKQLFLFIGAFCKGDNTAAQAFFSAYEATSRLYVDLIQELAQLANAVLTKFCSNLEYIRYEEFYDRLGPLIWEQKDASRRRLFAWHHPKNNLPLFTQYLYTITNMFDSMLSLCNDHTFVSIQQAIGKCPDVLEFTGLMQLVTTSLVPSVNAVGIEVQRPVHWHCGDPFKFYRTYFQELSHLEMEEEDPDAEMIRCAIEKWHRRKRKKASLAVQQAFRERDFVTVLGVSRDLFMEHVKKTESRCLSVILAFAAFAPPTNMAEMSTRFNDAIMMSQLNNTFLQIRQDNSDRDSLSATAVSYLSIIEKIGVQFPETSELLEGWEKSMTRRGFDPKRVFGAVEIINKQGKVQRLYFPIPNFVLTFWHYPEVQKIKDRVVLQVSRTSPEEKLADFRQWMDRIIKVMKRQELLRTWLTFPVHMVFGGKAVGYLQYLPSKRLWALILTMLFNLYYVYFSSLPQRFNPPEGSIANYLVSNDNNNIRDSKLPQLLEFLKVVLLVLNFTMFLSKMLNSYALQSLYDQIHVKNLWLNVVIKIATVPYALFLLMADAVWELILVALSFVGSYYDLYWFYAPMLLDVAFQVRFMRFLFDAVALNGTKITVTMLLAFLILYLYAVIATLYFNGQYDLDGHFGCNNVVSCFKLHLDYGIDNVPNWAGDFYIDPDLPLSFLYGPLLSRILGTVYSLSYVLLINLVLTSIISGLIIDTFSQLREENEFIQQDISDKCFVCSIFRDDFEQEGINFQSHIKDEHNMWHYVWFKIYLDSKDPLSYTSAEIYAAECMQDKTSFLQLMPTKKSLSIELKSGDDEDEEQLEDTLEEIIETLQKTRHQQIDQVKMLKTLKKSSARIEDRISSPFSY